MYKFRVFTPTVLEKLLAKKIMTETPASIATNPAQVSEVTFSSARAIKKWDVIRLNVSSGCKMKNLVNPRTTPKKIV